MTIKGTITQTVGVSSDLVCMWTFQNILCTMVLQSHFVLTFSLIFGIEVAIQLCCTIQLPGTALVYTSLLVWCSCPPLTSDRWCWKRVHAVCGWWMGWLSLIPNGPHISQHISHTTILTPEGEVASSTQTWGSWVGLSDNPWTCPIQLYILHENHIFAKGQN